MKSIGLAIFVFAGWLAGEVLSGCTPDVDQNPIVITSSNGPTLAQAHEPPSSTSPDAGVGAGDGGTRGDGGALGDGGVGPGGFDAMPTAFDAGAPTDVGSPGADAGVPPNP